MSSGITELTVIANCHTAPLAQIMAFAGLDIRVDGIFLDSWYDPASDARAKAAALVETPNNDGLVFSFNVGDNFDELATARLRLALGSRLITFSNIRFDGLHPDTTYFGSFGARWGNFLSEYHSRIVLFSYAAGRDVSDCLKLFCGTTYEALGYPEVFAASEAELRRRDLECDVRFCDTFFDMIREEICLLTINHPTTIVLYRLARALFSNTGLKFLDFDERMYPNPLVQAVIWPVYNEIAEVHRLKYRTPQYFVTPPQGYVASGSRSLSLESFIRGSYQYYDEHFARDQFVVALDGMDQDGRYRAVTGEFNL